MGKSYDHRKLGMSVKNSLILVIDSHFPVCLFLLTELFGFFKLRVI